MSAYNGFSGVLLLERIVNQEIQEAYSKLKTSFLEKGAHVTHEDAPNKVSFKQGSLWGLTPKTAKKTIDVFLEQREGGTYEKCTSTLSSDWRNITVVGCALAAVLVIICIWIGLDISGALATGKESTWSWLVSVGSNIDFQLGNIFVNLVLGLATFLLIVIGLETVILIYAYSKIDAYSSEILV